MPVLVLASVCVCAAPAAAVVVVVDARADAICAETCASILRCTIANNMSLYLSNDCSNKFAPPCPWPCDEPRNELASETELEPENEGIIDGGMGRRGVFSVDVVAVAEGSDTEAFTCAAEAAVGPADATAGGERGRSSKNDVAVTAGGGASPERVAKTQEGRTSESHKFDTQRSEDADQRRRRGRRSWAGTGGEWRPTAASWPGTEQHNTT